MRWLVALAFTLIVAACGGQARQEVKSTTPSVTDTSVEAGTTTPDLAETTTPDLAECRRVEATTGTSSGSYNAPPAMIIDPDVRYTATLDTSCGTIVIDLDVVNAPIGANNFVFLAREGFYDGLTFHRAVTNFVIQGGDPTGNGAGGPGYTVVTETPLDGYHVGDIAWAKTAFDEPGTAGSQFFIVTGQAEGLNAAQNAEGVYDYGAFGHVIEGLDVALLIESLSPGDGPPVEQVQIVSVSITES